MLTAYESHEILLLRIFHSFSQNFKRHVLLSIVERRDLLASHQVYRPMWVGL